MIAINTLYKKRNLKNTLNRYKRYIHITKMKDTTITVIYHYMSLTTVNNQP